MAAPFKPGQVFYLGRVRFVPGQHSALLGDWLEDFQRASSRRKVEMLEQLLAGGTYEAPVRVGGEDTETTDLLNDLLGI